MLEVVKKYLALVKFAHTIFAMPFALAGFFIAYSENKDFNWYLLILVVMCMVFARNAAMAFNRYIDRNFDAANLRTAVREIPSGLIKPKKALFFVIINCLLFVITTYFFYQSKLAFYLSPVALLIILGYSFCKRFTSLSHLVLGLGLGLAPVGAYIAVTGFFDIIPVLLSIMVFLWVSGFDIIYALQDIDFDKSQNLKSIPSRLGVKKSLIFSLILHLITIVILVIIGLADDRGILYWTGGLIFSVLLIYQHLIVKVHNLTRINLAFFTTNGIASVIYCTFYILDLIFN